MKGCVDQKKAWSKNHNPEKCACALNKAHRKVKNPRDQKVLFWSLKNPPRSKATSTKGKPIIFVTIPPYLVLGSRIRPFNLSTPKTLKTTTSIKIPSQLLIKFTNYQPWPTNHTTPPPPPSNHQQVPTIFNFEGHLTQIQGFSPLYNLTQTSTP